MGSGAFWAVAGGALPDMKDYAPKTKKQTERQKKISPQLTIQNTIKNEKSRSITLRPFPL